MYLNKNLIVSKINVLVYYSKDEEIYCYKSDKIIYNNWATKIKKMCLIPVSFKLSVPKKREFNKYKCNKLREQKAMMIHVKIVMSHKKKKFQINSREESQNGSTHIHTH